MPERGEIWLIDPDPAVGREQAGVRPGVVISIDDVNQGPMNVVVVVPLTTRERPGSDFPFHVRVPAEMSGLPRTSYAMCEQIRVVARNRVYGRRPRGRVDASTMHTIEDRLRIILGL